MPQNGQTEISDKYNKKFLRFGNVNVANYGFTLTQYWFHKILCIRIEQTKFESKW